MKKFTRVPDKTDIITREQGTDKYVTTTYDVARKVSTNYPDRYHFYVEMDVFNLEVFPVNEFYSKMCIEFVVDQSN